jgi:long-subunit acyl-CoA synthetase (AMP-forming)
MAVTLGIDVAVKAAHQASLAVDGKLVWTGRKFLTRPADLDRLWAALDLDDPSEMTVVLEPTRDAWIVLAAWFRSRGAKVVMVPTTWRAGRHYLIRDTDARVITAEEGHHIVQERFTVDRQVRINAANARQTQRRKNRAGRAQQKSPSAPASRPANPKPTSVQVA